MMNSMRNISSILLLAAAWALCLPMQADARSAAFVSPNAVKPTADAKNPMTSTVANTLVAEPGTIDAGETLVNIARRVTIFYTNGFHAPVQINDLSVNGDGNVRTHVITDDCKAVKVLPIQDKCAISLEITPISPGPWTVELLVNHSGLGRIARAEVNGTTLGKTDEKTEGLAISKKIASPMDFGNVVANEETAARTMLIENDSPAPLVISSIDLINSSQDGLSVRNTGCREGEELKPGESCPITVLWEPTENGNISTDLIVRHSGNLGFVVVPIRGAGTKSARDESGGRVGRGHNGPHTSSSDSGVQSPPSSLVPLPLPGNNDTQESLMPAIKSAMLTSKRKAPPEVNKFVDRVDESPVEKTAPKIMLIGTVGKRAILGDAQDQTYMVGLGEKTTIAGADVELLQLDPMRAVVMVYGKRIDLSLRNMQTIASQKGDGGDSDAGDADKSRSGGSGKSLAIHGSKYGNEDKRGSSSGSSGGSSGGMPVSSGGPMGPSPDYIATNGGSMNGAGAISPLSPSMGSGSSGMGGSPSATNTPGVIGSAIPTPGSVPDATKGPATSQDVMGLVR